MRGSRRREQRSISVSTALLGAVLLISATPAWAQYLGREQDITDLSLHCLERHEADYE